jgi:hypothetical protein
MVEGVRIYGADLYYMIRKMDEVTETLCREDGVLVLDLSGERRRKGNDFYDYVHITPEEARRVGQYLFEKFKNRV